MNNERYCLEQDDDGHWYVIPVYQKKLFNKLVTKAYREDAFDEFENTFGEYRVSVCSLTFTNPREEK